MEPQAMTRPSFRVFVTKHHGGLTSAVLLRRYRVLFDPPPPAAMAADEETALARLAAQAALIAEDAESAERYLWTEQLDLRRIEVDIHPGRPDPRGYVIAGATVPIRLGYAAAQLDNAPLWRVLVPRFDWSFVAEDLDAVPDTVRALVFASLVGDAPASLYDLRRELDEHIVDVEPARSRGPRPPEVRRAGRTGADARSRRRGLGRDGARRAPAAGRRRRPRLRRHRLAARRRQAAEPAARRSARCR
jgi:hypothetical protein